MVNKPKITGKMLLGEIANKYPEVAEIMAKHGLHCFGCHMASFETLEQGAISHGIDLGLLLKEMNAKINKRK